MGWELLPDLLLEFGGGYASSRRFVRLGPSYALALHRLSASTASLHVASLAGHDDAKSYAKFSKAKLMSES